MKREVQEAAKAVARDGLGILRKPFSSRSFGKAVASAADDLNISVGGGRVNLEGWINTDIDFRVAYYLDLMQPWPVSSESVARVYADNVIEHFSLSSGRVVLRNIFDALRSGGRLRIVTPDVERTVKAYLEDGMLARDHLQRHRRHGYVAEHPVDLLRVTFSEAGHHLGYCYDFASLEAELRSVGFREIHRLEVNVSDDLRLAGLESRASETESATALVVECQK